MTDPKPDTSPDTMPMFGDPPDKGLAAFDEKASEPEEKKTPKKRGRPPGKKDSKPRATKRGRPRKEPEPEPDLPPAEPIDPELVSALFSATMNPICMRAGVPELSKEELKAGGEAWAPILDHYFPATAAKMGIWAAPVVWTLGVSVPRVEMAIKLRRDRKELELAGDPNAAPFRPDTPASGEDSPEPDTGTPVTPSGTIGAVVSENEIKARRKSSQ